MRLVILHARLAHKISLVGAQLEPFVGLNKVQGRPFLVSEIEEAIDKMLA